MKNEWGNGCDRVEFSDQTGTTVSEGMGYGMVLTAYYGDQTEFDGLWKFAQKNFGASHLMGWHVTCAGVTSGDGGGGTATDGDEDIALALIVAAPQWGGSFQTAAHPDLADLEKIEFPACIDRAMPTAG